MPTERYRLKLVRGEDQFEAEGDREFVLEMLMQHWSPKPAVSVASSAQPSVEPVVASSPASPGAKALSVGEFIRQVGVQKHTALVLAFGYFIEKHQGQPSFGAADVNNLYYEAKLEASNTSQMIIQNIRAGLMMEAKGEKPGKKKYTLTQKGEREITSRLESASPAAQ